MFRLHFLLSENLLDFIKGADGDFEKSYDEDQCICSVRTLNLKPKLLSLIMSKTAGKNFCKGNYNTKLILC